MEYLRIHFEMKLEAEDIICGEGLICILEEIAQSCSLKQACEKLGMAYSKGWKILREAERRLGRMLIVRQAGGKGGGSSVITPFARELIVRFRQIQHELIREGERLSREYLLPLTAYSKEQEEEGK